MNETRHSLLLRAQTGETAAWKDLTDLYRPLILGWLNRQGVPARDLEDLSQEVLLSVVQHLPGFPRRARTRGSRIHPPRSRNRSILNSEYRIVIPCWVAAEVRVRRPRRPGPSTGAG